MVERIMADNITEAPKGPTQTGGIKPSEVAANASLSEQQRLESAQELLGTPLKPEQEKAILEAHKVGEGEQGKSGGEAGIGNYTNRQLGEKIKILKEAGFTKEQWKTLLRKGIAGAVRPGVIDIDPIPIATIDAVLGRFATLIKSTGDDGRADEDFLNRTATTLSQLYFQGTVDETLALQMLTDLQRWKITAEAQRPGQRIERLPGPNSAFENIITAFENITNAINQLEQQLPSLSRDAALEDARNALENARGERDTILTEIREAGLLNPAKAVLFKTFYDSRVEVTYRDKVSDRRADGTPGVLRNLQDLQDSANNTSWEASHPRFWEDPQIQAAVQLLGGRDRIGGAIDYFERESLKLITDVVRNRKRYDNPYNPEAYPDRGIVGLWDYTHTRPSGIDLEAADFTGVRDIVEKERKEKPKVPNRGDYESWIALVADDPEEAEEMIPYIVGSVKGKLVGPPQTQSNTLQSEQEKWVKAIDYLRTQLEYGDDAPEFIRLATIVRQELNLLGIQVFSDLVKETWEPYLTYEADIARGFKDTEFQDHTIDVLLLDREGIKLAALELLALNNWEYYRFGRNIKDTNETLAYGDALKWQQQRRDWIENWLVNHELRPMDELLNANTRNNQVIINGDPTHPAFQRMKAELDALDAVDPQRTAPGFIPRWHEYVRKAIHWQRTGESSNPRNKRQRVIFQHPLARAFRPRGFRDEQGNVTSVDEFWTMFRRVEISDPKQRKRMMEAKRDKVGRALKSAERMVKFSTSDAVAGAPRHYFEVYDDTGTLTSPHGEIITNAQGQNFLKLATGTELRIEFDSNGKPFVNEIEPHMKLLHDLMQRINEADKKKPIKRRIIKLYNILREKVGIDLALPTFSAWYLGAHDSNRPHLLKYLRQVPEWAQQLEERAKLREFDAAEGNDGYGYGADPKTAMARMPEDERRLRILAEVYIRNKYSKYYNYPGHDDPEGGVKEFRNLLLQVYGISMGTVEVNALIRNSWLGEVDFLGAFGCETWEQFVGLEKGPNELVYALTRGFFANPRDAENYVKRLAASVEQAKLWTSGAEGSHGVLNDALISGAFTARAMDINTAIYLHTDVASAAMLDPLGLGYLEMDEQSYRTYVETSARIAAPLMKIMEARLKLENVYGRNPQSAMLLNTLLWYDLCKWMDENPEEFRAKFGFAHNVNLPMARLFIHTFLYEGRFIYNDVQWDRLMLGYTIPKDQWDAIQNWSGNPDTKPTLDSVIRKNTGINRADKLIRYSADANGNTLGYSIKQNKDGTVEWVYDGTVNNVNEGEVVEGLLDALPKEVREEALANRWIPVGISSYYPETLNSLRQFLPIEHIRNKKLYQDILKQAEQDIAKANDPNYTPKFIKRRRVPKRA